MADSVVVPLEVEVDSQPKIGRQRFHEIAFDPAIGYIGGEGGITGVINDGECTNPEPQYSVNTSAEMAQGGSATRFVEQDRPPLD